MPVSSSKQLATLAAQEVGAVVSCLPTSRNAQSTDLDTIQATHGMVLVNGLSYRLKFKKYSRSKLLSVFVMSLGVAVGAV
eukprot:4067047-Amphidinium_carterae.1